MLVCDTRQVGAMVRYSLDPDIVLALTLYLRGEAALAGSRQQEAGLGLAVRSSTRVPVEAQFEARATRDAPGLHVRAAALLISNLPPIGLPADFRARGYVGGELASAFVDGQVWVEHPIVHIGNVVVTAGDEVWGAARCRAARYGDDRGDFQRPAACRGRQAIPPHRQSRSQISPAITLSEGF